MAVEKIRFHTDRWYFHTELWDYLGLRIIFVQDIVLFDEWFIKFQKELFYLFLEVKLDENPF